jgi:flagellar motor switch/type III secretory pathway protein FliN
MLALSFAPPQPGKNVRELRWERQSRVVLDQACAIANGVRECLVEQLGTQVEVWVHEPIAPNPALLAALLAEAELFEIAAARTAAWLFLDSLAARRLVAAAFQDDAAPATRPWSPLETDVLLRLVQRIADSCEPLLGQIRIVQASGDLQPALLASSLVAIRVSKPVELEFDLLLAQDPPPVGGTTLDERLLLELSLPVRAIAGTIHLQIRELIALEIGAVLPMSRLGQAQLVVDQTKIAHGACGVTGGRLAFRIGTCNESQGV